MHNIFDIETHIVVHLEGKCKSCNKNNVLKIHDYGEMKYGDLENKMDETNHAIKPITCSKCGNVYSPYYIVYSDLKAGGKIVAKRIINYSHVVDVETSKAQQEGHAKRFEIFQQHEEDFWNKYIQYALADFRAAINELLKEEIEEAYKKLNISTNDTWTISKYRKDVLNRFTTLEEKSEFWKLSNRYFVYSHVLELGVSGWVVEGDIKRYGPNRMRFIILNFPMHESFESIRTELIGKVVNKEKGDNAFLFRRIHQLTNEINRARAKGNEYYHKIEELKADNANLQNKLHDAYMQIKDLREDKNIISRDPLDVMKIQELKSFITVLMTELKEKDKKLLELSPVEETALDPMELEEDDNAVVEEITEEITLEGKTIGIIGGMRKEQATKYDNILTHPGFAADVDFLQLLKQSDIVVVLTEHVSHAAMWEAKAYCINNDKPILFDEAININRILENVKKAVTL